MAVSLRSRQPVHLVALSVLYPVTRRGGEKGLAAAVPITKEKGRLSRAALEYTEVVGPRDRTDAVRRS